MGSRPPASRHLAVALAAFALACAGSPDPRFYALQPLESPEKVASLPGLGVAIGPVNLPRYLDEPRIVTRKDESRVEYRDYDRWAGGSLESEVLRTLGENLGLLLGTDRVVVYPLRGPFPIRYTVRLDVERFDGRRGDGVDLRARWVISSSERPDAVAVEISDFAEPIDGGKTRALVEAHGALLGRLSHAIAERIARLEEARQSEPAE